MLVASAPYYNERIVAEGAARAAVISMATADIIDADGDGRISNPTAGGSERHRPPVRGRVNAQPLADWVYHARNRAIRTSTSEEPRAVARE
jgi:hypothetical protein